MSSPIEPVSIAGDSAGGGLAFSCATQSAGLLVNECLPVSLGLVRGSIFAQDNESYELLAELDPLCYRQKSRSGTRVGI